jgi:hypothetical protein
MRLSASASITVTAWTSDEAIEWAIKEYDVPPHERFRISVQREA